MEVDLARLEVTRVEAEIGQPVRFRVHTLRTDGRWAFVSALPLTKEHGRIDYATTKFAADVEEGLFDDGLRALLEKRGDRWTITAFEIGATDAGFVDWPDRHGAPVGLLPRLAVDASQPSGTVLTTGWQVAALDAEERPPGGWSGRMPPEIAAGWRIGGGAPFVVADPAAGAYPRYGWHGAGLTLIET